MLIRSRLLAAIASIIAVFVVAYVAIQMGAFEKSSTQSSTPEVNHIVITPRTYPSETHANYASGRENGKFVSVYSSLMLNYCDVPKVEHDTLVPGLDDSNPIILKKNGGEKSAQFCLVSQDSNATTWELMARDDIKLYPDFPKALEDGVRVSFDKSVIYMPAIQVLPDGTAKIPSGNFTIFLSADTNTVRGDKAFSVYAVRHLDDIDREVQMLGTFVHVRVID